MSEENKTEVETKKTKSKKGGCGICRIFMFFLTALIWLTAGVFGSMPWWHDSELVPSEVRKYLPKLPQARVLSEIKSDETSVQLAFDDSEIRGDIEELENKIAKVYERIEKIEEAKAENPERLVVDEKSGESVDLTNFADLKEVESLKEEIASIQQKIKENHKLIADTQSSINTKLTDVSNKTEQIGDTTQIQSAIAKSNQKLATTIAVFKLDDAISKGKPFTNELNIVKNVMGVSEENPNSKIAELEKHAENGIASPASLILEFKDIAPKAVWSALKIPEDNAWQRIIAKVKGMISLRKTTVDMESDSPQAVIARAEILMEKSDIAEAVAEIVKITDTDVLSVLSDWIKKTEAYLEVSMSVRELLMDTLELGSSN